MILSSRKNTSTVTTTVPFCNMDMSQCKKLQPMEDKSTSQNYLPSSRSFSTASLVGNVLTKLVNIFKTVEKHTIPLEKNRQSFSAPDIYVDKNINAPIFETKYGITKLTIPDDPDINVQTKSLSVGNSPFSWCPITVGSSEYTGLPRKIPKRAKIKSRDIAKKIDNVSKPRRHFSMQNHHAIKNKNFKKKNRHSVMADMMEDYGQLTDCSDFDSDNEYAVGKQIEECIKNKDVCLMTSTLKFSLPLHISEESFPQICSMSNMTAKVMPADRQNLLSECESEDSFVVFSDDLPFITPSASPAKKNDLCTAINSFFSTSYTVGSQRQRQLSEGSDDSIVFCDDSDVEQFECKTKSISDDAEDTDDEYCDSDTDERMSHQPDSGFEEKKVRFNLNPEVHVMRTWDFAYRKARIGEWEMAARDRERFKMRIIETEQILKPVFEKKLRDRIYSERLDLLS